MSSPLPEWKGEKDDVNPPRFYEVLSSGPYEGKTISKVEVEEDRRKYYEEVGWDEKGIPETEVLRELGLENVDSALRKVRQTAWD